MSVASWASDVYSPAGDGFPAFMPSYGGGYQNPQQAMPYNSFMGGMPAYNQPNMQYNPGMGGPGPAPKPGKSFFKNILESFTGGGGAQNMPYNPAPAYNQPRYPAARDTPLYSSQTGMPSMGMPSMGMPAGIPNFLTASAGGFQLPASLTPLPPASTSLYGSQAGFPISAAQGPSLYSSTGGMPNLYSSTGGMPAMSMQTSSFNTGMPADMNQEFSSLIPGLPPGAKIISARPLSQDPAYQSTTQFTSNPVQVLPSQAGQADIRGVGITFAQEPDATTGMVRVFVQRIREGSSAAQSGGVSEGDTLISVNGNNVFGQSLNSLRNLIPGPANTPVKLGFQAEDGKRREVELLRTTARDGRRSNPALQFATMPSGGMRMDSSSGNLSETPSIALGDEAGTYTMRAMNTVNSMGQKVLYQGNSSQHTPEGWERKVDPQGFVFWVHHIDKKISYTPPGLKLVSLQPSNNGMAPAMPIGGQYTSYAPSYTGSDAVDDSNLDGQNQTLTQV